MFRKENILGLPTRFRGDDGIKPDVIDWRITSKCSRSCLFCYGPEKQDLQTSEARKVIQWVSSLGVRVLGLTGGEPLLRHDITELLWEIKETGMMCCLSTNGDYFERNRSAILDCTDVVGLPIEGSTPALHDSLRGPDSFSNVTRMLADLYEHGHSYFRIGTVLTKANHLDLSSIAALLSPYADRIVYWKIYELICYSEREKQDVSSLHLPGGSAISVESLESVIGIGKVWLDSCEARARSYFLIDPNGDAIVPVTDAGKTKDLILGNVLRDDREVIMHRWLREINWDGYGDARRCCFRHHPSLLGRLMKSNDEITGPSPKPQNH